MVKFFAGFALGALTFVTAQFVAYLMEEEVTYLPNFPEDWDGYA